MSKLRYTFVAILLAASVVCFALWWRSEGTRDQITGRIYLVAGPGFGLASAMGICTAHTIPEQYFEDNGWAYLTSPVTKSEIHFKERFIDENGYFSSKKYGGGSVAVYFPLWYPALVFALAGVGVLRFRWRFSIRSALIVTAVVAAMIGMAMIL